MKRAALTHGRVFSDEDFADEYARKHTKMAEKFGQAYCAKLNARGFRKGRIILMVRLFLSWFLKLSSQFRIDVGGEAEQFQDSSL